MSDLKGLFYPRTPSGKASIVPPVPWHYSGELITLEYRTDPARVAALLPNGFEPADEDPGAVAAIWADWQSVSEEPGHLLDPVRVQYKEMFFVVRCKFEGKHYSRCIYIWVDKEFAVLRGQHQGYPKKLGSIHMSRPVVVGKAGPRLEPGGTFGVTLAAFDRRLAEGRFTITDTAEKPGFVNGLPMAHNRWMPSIETDGTDSLDEVVTMASYDVDFGRCFKGDFDLSLFDSPVEELLDIAPQEKIAGYWHEVGVSWKAGTTLRRRNRV
ncbi:MULTISPECIES: acetoacetate decarboxylase family protein [unclassified Novosphingobium]|uniref:acetoacetate decarboxylase family protein n=1 Tax=unclassified Novosphingobium TaxID=2644732 RepID=UPI000F5F992E|nr:MULTISPECIES: acetoacetate decarboxylase family protein [unclassified Novosphingobium]MBF5092944.1 acetoacetate decarboxylase [Novosphingobium sp. NBM11]RQW43679.1 acetoacetate decarboxylase [Novosphingobium sp. LASN5T]